MKVLLSIEITNKDTFRKFLIVFEPLCMQHRLILCRAKMVICKVFAAEIASDRFFLLCNTKLLLKTKGPCDLNSSKTENVLH